MKQITVDDVAEWAGGKHEIVDAAFDDYGANIVTQHESVMLNIADIENHIGA